MKKLALLSLVALLPGCVMVPANTIKFGHFTYSSRKNIAVENITVQVNGTNILVSAAKISSVNDPAVIDRTAAGQVAIIGAIEKAMLDAAAKAK